MIASTTDDRAAKMLAFITEHANAGRTVHLATALRVTVIKQKHLSMVRVRSGALEVSCGNQGWLNYTYAHLSTQGCTFPQLGA
jgi:hypothetical protein